jgi:hypothetical protein
VRTTIALDDAVFRAYKRRAAERGTTLAREIEDTLRTALLRQDEDDGEPFELITVDGGPPRSEIDYTSNVGLLDLVDNDSPHR